MQLTRNIIAVLIDAIVNKSLCSGTNVLLMLSQLIWRARLHIKFTFGRSFLSCHRSWIP